VSNRELTIMTRCAMHSLSMVALKVYSYSDCLFMKRRLLLCILDDRYEISYFN